MASIGRGANGDGAVTALLIYLVALSFPVRGQERGWVVQRAGEIEIYTRIRAAARGELLSALGETRETLDRDLRRLPETVLPVLVLVEPGWSAFAKFRRFETAKGFCQTGRDRDYIVLTEDSQDLERVARHEMTHRHLNRSGPWLPDWLEEGLAEYYSTLRRSGLEVTAGGEIAAHRRVLREERWLPESALQGANPATTGTADVTHTSVFYAQSWALVHYLNTDAGRRRGLASYLQALAGGADPGAAYRDSFGETLGATLEKVRDYLAQPLLPVRRIEGVAAPAPREAARVSEDELQALRAEIHLSLGQREEADPIWKSLADQGSSRDAQAAARMGMLALARQDFGAARQALERAIALESRNPEVWFEFAMLLRDGHAASGEVERHLARTLELAPGFAPAWAQLAKSKDRRGSVREAEADLRRAVEIDPRRFEYLEALAELLHRSGPLDEAIALMQRAERAAQSPSERRQARALLELWQQEKSRPAVAVKPGKPEVRTPDSWKPAGGATVTGLLIRVDCPDTGLVFRIRTAAGEIALEARDPSQVTMSGPGGGRSFSCGPQSPSPAVTAVYTPASATAPATLLRLEIR